MTEPERVPFLPRVIPAPKPGRMAYIGTAPCGCVTFALAVTGDSDEPTKLERVTRSGRVIDRVTVREARERLTTCTHAMAA